MTDLHAATANAAYRSLLENFHWEVIPMKNLEDQRKHIPAGEPVSVTCSPVKGIEETVRLAEEFVHAGHPVTAHFAGRMVTSVDDLKGWLGRLDAVGVTSLFCIAGDGEEPAGPFKDSLQLIEAVLEHETSISTIGFGAYPDGHAFIDDAALRQALHTKQLLLTNGGKQGWASTQMCFDAAKIAAWIDTERTNGFELPIYLGVAGAVDRKKLMTMGMRLGIGASLGFLKKNRSTMSRLLGAGYDANEIFTALAPTAGARGIVATHGFTFNQIENTVAWREESLRSLS